MYVVQVFIILCVHLYSLCKKYRNEVPQVSTGLSSHVSIPYIVQFYFHVGTMII